MGLAELDTVGTVQPGCHPYVNVPCRVVMVKGPIGRGVLESAPASKTPFGALTELAATNGPGYIRRMFPDPVIIKADGRDIAVEDFGWRAVDPL